MAGTVHVVAAGQPTTAQATADSQAGATQAQILGQVSSLRSQTSSAVSSEKRADGTTLWKMFTNAATKPAPQPGGGTGYLEMLEYTPSTLSITAGDAVQWTATAPHTVTFLKPG